MEGGTRADLLGVEHWTDPAEQPADRTTLQQYDVDEQVLARWRDALKEYLSARAALIRQVERQGWGATPRPRDRGYVDIVFTGPPDEQPPGFVEVEDTEGRSIRFGEWIERVDGHWVLRIPTG
jgi:hypothetical protein